MNLRTLLQQLVFTSTHTNASRQALLAPTAHTRHVTRIMSHVTCTNSSRHVPWTLSSMKTTLLPRHMLDEVMSHVQVMSHIGMTSRTLDTEVGMSATSETCAGWSHVARTHESCHTYERVTSRTMDTEVDIEYWGQFVGAMLTEVMSHVHMSHVTYRKESCYAPCTLTWTLVLIQWRFAAWSHVTRTYESRHT